ncbi:MAG: hypothetical protein AB1656_03495 [Candidatus Omnitrophota bacterium]
MKQFRPRRSNDRSLLPIGWIAGRITPRENMDNARQLLYGILQTGASGASRDSSAQRLTALMLTQLGKQPWFPAQEEKWCERIAASAADGVMAKLMALAERQMEKADLETHLDDLADDLTSTVFYTPEGVRLIYSPHPPVFDALAQTGAEIHSRLIHRAAFNAVRRNASGLKHLSLNPADLSDELWGAVMEELLRCLGDASARVWTKGDPAPAVFPLDGVRGARQGIILRVALSKDGTRLAAVRSDSMLYAWNVPQRELIRCWDLKELNPLSEKRWEPAYLYFSQTGAQLALETDAQMVFTFSLEESDLHVGSFREENKEVFLQQFGEPFLPDLELAKTSALQIRAKSGILAPLSQYLQKVYDWTCDAKGKTIATASEQERAMPEWMLKAGFERAVFHIAKKRLIDLIRKHTHTSYACWRCGSMISGPSETKCRRCGADFTRCPAGCPIPPSEPLGAANRWQCPHCGLAARVWEPIYQVELEDRMADSEPEIKEWQRRHDMERIQRALRKESLAYKNREIAFDRLLSLKAEGITNEEIAIRLDIPRGSVDYVWNQCKQRIMQFFGEN